jgi:5-formyltetrahydrofolate cyclo-ligase
MSDQKRALRSELIAARARMTQDERRTGSLAIAERLDDLPAFREARLVAVYAPLGTEVDASGIARRAASRGQRVVFPRTVPGDRRLAFAECDAGALVRGPLGALEPPAGAPELDLGDIQCVVMPGVAFSEDGLRLGRGGGYYDATLARMPRAVRIGLAFDRQIVPALPREPHDAQLDAVVSETRTLLFSREGAGASESR